MVNIRKWLKRIHNHNGDMSSNFLNEIPRHSISNDVWTDLSIKVNVSVCTPWNIFSNAIFCLFKDFELAITDDLFEVKLFQNYCVSFDSIVEKEVHGLFR